MVGRHQYFGIWPGKLSFVNPDILIPKNNIQWHFWRVLFLPEGKILCSSRLRASHRQQVLYWLIPRGICNQTNFIISDVDCTDCWISDVSFLKFIWEPYISSTLILYIPLELFCMKYVFPLRLNEKKSLKVIIKKMKGVSSLWGCVPMQYLIEANFIVHCHGKDKWETKKRSFFMSLFILPLLFSLFGLSHSSCRPLSFPNLVNLRHHHLSFSLHQSSSSPLPSSPASSPFPFLSSLYLCHHPAPPTPPPPPSLFPHLLSSFLFFHSVKCVAH